MEANQSPKFFERWFKRVSGSLKLEKPEDFLSLIKQANSQQILDPDTSQRLENIIHFNQLAVRDAMITRSQMNVIRATESIERIISYVIDTAHSRFPVIADDKDHILGIVHAKDLLKYISNPEHFRIEQILRPAVFVPESKPLNILLKEFQEQHHHMAIVVDEYGGISGLVTFEDLIEQIVGKISDEFDEDDSADNIFPVSSERWRVNAVTKIEDFNLYFGTQYTDEEFDTIGGLVIHELGHLPVRGEKVIIDDWQFSVARADNRRLHTVMVMKIKENPKDKEIKQEEA